MPGNNPTPSTMPSFVSAGDTFTIGTTFGGSSKYAIRTKKEVKVPTPDEEMAPIAAKPGFTFGCDPEVFIFNEKGEPVYPEMIPGTKEEPYYLGDDVFVQRDGMAAEFNITPAANFEDWDKRIATALEKIQGLLPTGYSWRNLSYVRFSEEAMLAAPEEALELGCHPDCNAWTGRPNPPPNLEFDPFLRTAAGHIHAGWTKDAELTDSQHILTCRDFVKQLDWYIGAWTVLKDPDVTRRSLYGKAGACRFKPYGVEYRTPSNFWIADTVMRKVVWNRLQAAVNAMKSLFQPDQVPAGWSEILAKGIDCGFIDRTLATSCAYPISNIDFGG